jgi:hypothetical protein
VRNGANRAVAKSALAGPCRFWPGNSGPFFPPTRGSVGSPGHGGRGQIPVNDTPVYLTVTGAPQRIVVREAVYRCGRTGDRDLVRTHLPPPTPGEAVRSGAGVRHRSGAARPTRSTPAASPWLPCAPRVCGRSRWMTPRSRVDLGLERGGAADRGAAEMRRSGEVPTLAATSADLLDATPARVWQACALRAGVWRVVSLP